MKLTEIKKITEIKLEVPDEGMFEVVVSDGESEEIMSQDDFLTMVRHKKMSRGVKSIFDAVKLYNEYHKAKQSPKVAKIREKPPIKESTYSTDDINKIANDQEVKSLYNMLVNFRKDAPDAELYSAFRLEMKRLLKNIMDDYKHSGKISKHNLSLVQNYGKEVKTILDWYGLFSMKLLHGTVVKESDMKLNEVKGYSIGATGLEKPKQIALFPNSKYYMGASSSPDVIIVTKVGDSVINYVFPGETTEHRIERWIGEDLIFKGTTTWIKHYGSHWPEMVASFEANFAGKKGKLNGKDTVEDHKKVEVFVKSVKPVTKGMSRAEDPWYKLEDYGFVGMLADGTYSVVTTVKVSKELMKDKEFEVIEVRSKS